MWPAPIVVCDPLFEKAPQVPLVERDQKIDAFTANRGDQSLTERVRPGSLEGRLVDPEQHIEAPHPGHLLCQDSYFVGTIKGVGKIYQQTVIDAHSSHVFAKLLSLEDSNDGGRCAERSCAALLRGAQRGDRAPAHRTMAENTVGARSGIPSSSIWPSSKSRTGAPTSVRRKPTVSANAFIAR